MKKEITVLILNYNGSHLLQQFIPGILDNLPEIAKVAIVDNGSQDDSVRILQDKFSMVDVILLDHNFGFAEGYNKAIAQIDTPYIAIVNSDVEFVEDWLTPAYQILSQQENVAAVQPKIKDYHRREFFEYAGAAGGFLDTLGYSFCRGRVFDTIEKDLGQYDQTLPIFWASGAAMLVKTRLFIESGGFDPDFFAHMEEIDLCFRWQRKGYSLLCLGEKEVYHIGGGTLSYQDERKTFLNFRNNLMLILKNYPMEQLVWKLPLRMILDGIAALRFLAMGQFSSFRSVFFAHIAFYRAFKTTWKKRTLIRRDHAFLKGNPQCILPIVLPIQYFVLGNKRFFTLFRSKGKYRI